MNYSNKYFPSFDKPNLSECFSFPKKINAKITDEM